MTQEPMIRPRRHLASHSDEMLGFCKCGLSSESGLHVCRGNHHEVNDYEQSGREERTAS
jgi:hypothetical protein